MKKIFLFSLLSIYYIESYSQTKIPDSFLNIKLGMSFKEFHDQTYAERNFRAETDIDKKSDLFIYTINKKTSSGDDVRLNCGFYNDRLEYIKAYYDKPVYDILFQKDFLNPLIEKYEKYTDTLSKSEKYTVIGDYKSRKEIKHEIFYEWDTKSYNLTMISENIAKLDDDGTEIKNHWYNIILIFHDKTILEKRNDAFKNKKSNKID